MFDVLANLPQLPSWIVKYLNDSTNKKLNMYDYGLTALEAKQAEIEFYNQSVKSRMEKRIPEQLSIYEAAILLMHRYYFRNVFTDKGYQNTQLAVYMESGIARGTYSTQIKEMNHLIFMIAPMFDSRTKKEVIDTIEIAVPNIKQIESPDLTAVNNGIFDKKNQKLLKFDPKYVFLAKLRTDYNPNAKKPTYTFADGETWTPDEIFKVASNDPDVETLLWQVAADFFQPNYTREKSIFLYSEKGNNGKGTYGTLLESIVGQNNVAHLAVDDLKHEFLKESLIGKVGNIAHENNVNEYIDNVRDFKALVTGDNIVVNRKYEKPIHLQFKGTNIQMFNGLPKTKDKSASFYRRLLLVPFTRSFTNNGQRPDIKNVFIHETDVKEYVLMTALHLQFTEFIDASQSKEALREYKEENDPVIEFWIEFSDEFVWDILPLPFLYELFLAYHSRTNPSGKPLSKQTFVAQLRNYLEDDEMWEDKTKMKTHTGDKMDKDELLITEYNLQNWIDPTYRGKDMTKLRDFKRKVNYRGYVRKP